MLINLLLGITVMLFCLLFQSGLTILSLRYYVRSRLSLGEQTFRSSMAVIGGVMLLQVLGILGQSAIWAGLFMFLLEFDQFRVAFYHSTVNFASLGYGDIVMSEQRRLLGALESVNGVLMIGLSTAMLMTAIQRMFNQNFSEILQPQDVRQDRD